MLKSEPERGKKAQEKVRQKEKKNAPSLAPMNGYVCAQQSERCFLFKFIRCLITQEKGNKSGCCLTFKNYRFPVNHPATDII